MSGKVFYKNNLNYNKHTLLIFKSEDIVENMNVERLETT